MELSFIIGIGVIIILLAVILVWAKREIDRNNGFRK
jgi:uncharacterized membrane protein (DUF373 family)